MLRTYATGCTWPLSGAADLASAVRRAEAVARSLGWSARDAGALSLVVMELGRDALQQGGGGTCRREAGATFAHVIVEDLGGGRARARVAFSAALPGPLATAV